MFSILLVSEWVRVGFCVRVRVCWILLVCECVCVGV